MALKERTKIAPGSKRESCSLLFAGKEDWRSSQNILQDIFRKRLGAISCRKLFVLSWGITKLMVQAIVWFCLNI